MYKRFYPRPGSACRQGGIGMIDQKEVNPFNEAHYHLAMQVAGVGLWDWDIVHDKQFWNDECRAILGVPSEFEASLAHFMVLVHPEDRRRVQEHLAESMQKRVKQNIQYRIVWPDGSLHWAEAKGKFLYGEQGQVIRLLGVIFDITAQKEAELAQLEAERRVREILESVGEAFAHLDRNWRFTYVNSRAEYNLETGAHVPLEDVLGRSVWDVYPEMIGTPAEEALRQVMETRKPEAFEVYYPGLKRWYDFHTYPAGDGGITNFITDITASKTLERERNRLLKREQKARRESEAARRRSEGLVKKLEHQQAFARAIVDQAPSGLIIAEAPSGKIIFCNEEALKLLGRELREASGFADYLSYRMLHSDSTPYKAEEYPLARALLKGEVVTDEEMLYYTPNGKLVHVSTNAAPIRDAQGAMLAGVLTFHDTTERYELERKKDEFIAMASHELRTPLTSLRGNLQLAERRLKQIQEKGTYLTSPEGRVALERLIMWIERALRQVKAESRLINDLLDATRIQAEALHVALEPCDLAQVVSDAVNDVRMMAYTRTIELTLPKQGEVCVKADSVRIGQVVTNYLTNALKYSAESQPVRVGIDLTKCEASVWVKDAGLGLSPEAQQAIWDRFYRISNFTEYAGLGSSGLGLGLYINREIILQHGGTVGVSSEIGKGSIFWFTLPLAKK